MKVRETTEEKEYLIEENKRCVTSASQLDIPCKLTRKFWEHANKIHNILLSRRYFLLKHTSVLISTMSTLCLLRSS